MSSSTLTQGSSGYGFTEETTPLPASVGSPADFSSVFGTPPAMPHVSRLLRLVPKQQIVKRNAGNQAATLPSGVVARLAAVLVASGAPADAAAVASVCRSWNRAVVNTAWLGGAGLRLRQLHTALRAEGIDGAADLGLPLAVNELQSRGELPVHAPRTAVWYCRLRSTVQPPVPY